MRSSAVPYPSWSYFPRNVHPPAWVNPVLDAVAEQESVVSTATGQGPKSDDVLKAIAPALQAQGFTVELTKTKVDRIRRPVLFGENGRPAVTYEIDAWHNGHGIAVEVEAGRGTQNNADYRDIIRTSLLLDARVPRGAHAHSLRPAEPGEQPGAGVPAQLRPP